MPPSRVYPTRIASPSLVYEGGVTWAVFLLPWLEQDNLYRQFDVSLTYYDQNPLALGSNFKGYFCPSRRASDGSPRLSVSGDVPPVSPPGYPHQPGGLADYAVVIDPSGDDRPNPVSNGSNGAFQMGTGLRLLDFRDGLSNTLMVGEKHVPVSKYGVGWWDCSTYNGNYGQCSSRAASRSFPLTTNPQDMRWLFGSVHTGVVQFCFADGGVRVLPQTINPLTLELLSNRNDGQVIPDY
jgi:hypothetical protein